MTPLNEQNIWVWIDEGSAEQKLAELRNDPQTPQEDLLKIERLMALNREMKSLPVQRVPDGFNASVLARLQGGVSALHAEFYAPILSRTWRIGLSAGLGIVLLILSVLGLISGGTATPINAPQPLQDLTQRGQGLLERSPDLFTSPIFSYIALAGTIGLGFIILDRVLKYRRTIRLRA